MQNEKITTELRFEGGKIVSFFGNHSPIDIMGFSKVMSVPEAWSPPHLLVAAVESCVLLTTLMIAEKMHIRIKSYSSTAEGLMSSDDGKHYEISEIILRPTFHLENEQDRSRLNLLVKKAQEYCLVSNSLKTKVKIEI